LEKKDQVVLINFFKKGKKGAGHQIGLFFGAWHRKIIQKAAVLRSGGFYGARHRKNRHCRVLTPRTSALARRQGADTKQGEKDEQRF